MRLVTRIPGTPHSEEWSGRRMEPATEMDRVLLGTTMELREIRVSAHTLI